MKSARASKIATLMVHTSPLDQAGIGDAGGMNVYVVETAKKMAQAGVSVDIFTRANHPNLPDTVEIAEGVNVISVTVLIKVILITVPELETLATLLILEIAIDNLSIDSFKISVDGIYDSVSSIGGN